jgi:hypothetical protein
MLEKAEKIMPPNRQVLPQVGDLQWRERQQAQAAADERLSRQPTAETAPGDEAPTKVAPRMDSVTLGADPNIEYGDYTAALKARAKIKNLGP